MPELILSCEHGGHNIPSAYTSIFKGQKEVLTSHRGWDIGALKLCREIAAKLDCSPHFSEVSRLVVDLNRSLGNRKLFSEFTLNLSAKEKENILQNHYLPYRQKVERHIVELLARRQRVLHFAIHSFTPSLNGQIRRTDIGFLYDPKRPHEKMMVQNIKQIFRERGYHQSLCFRCNDPYKGVSDGFPSYLRRQLGESYAGFEIEVNNRLLRRQSDIQNIATIVASCLKEACLSCSF